MRLAVDLPRCRFLGGSNMVMDASWCRKEFDPFWRLYRNRDGGAEILHGGGRLALEAGSFYLVPAWTVFKGRSPGGIRHDFIHFQVAGLPAAWLRRHACAPLRLDPGADWPAIMDRIGGEQAPGRHLLIQGMLCSAVAQALASAPEPGEATQAARVVAPALALAESRLANPPTVAEMAEAAGLSPDHLARCVVQVTGQTPARWLQERRVIAAAEQLTGGVDDIEAISARLGFANRCHFTRVFRRVTGTTPAAYRRELGGGSRRA